MKKTILGVAALTALAFAACKKNDDQSNAQKILGKWQMINNIEVITNKATGSVFSSDTSSYSNGSYADFRSDGYIYSYEKYGTVGEYDTVKYKVDGDKLIQYFGTDGNDTSRADALKIKFC